MNIFNQVRSEIDDFLYNDIEVVPGYNFNQYETIKRAHLYLNSQFQDSSLYNGREKIFYNISTPRKDTVVRFLDIDTKDIKIHDLDPKSTMATSLLQKELEIFMRKHNIAHKLNQLADEVVTYGSVVLKDTKDGPVVQDLRRLFLDPTVENITDSRFITYVDYYTPDQLRKKVNQGWDEEAIEKIIKHKEDQESDAPQAYEGDHMSNEIRSTKLIEVYTRYGNVPEKFIKGGKSEKSVPAVCIVAEPYMTGENDRGEEEERGQVMFKGKWNKDFPFRDFHFTKTRGRWLGIGVMEALFPAQERMNELANQKRISMELSTLHLFQSADPTIINNMLEDLQNGDVIKVKQPNAIQPIVNEERNLPAFAQEANDYVVLADRISFANDFIAGGNLPSTTPATNAVIQNNNATSVHLFKRENFAIFLTNYFNDYVIPQLVKDLTAEHVLRFVGDSAELDQIDQAVAENAVRSAQLQAGGLITQPLKDKLFADALAQLKKRGNKRFIKVIKDYYKDKEVEIGVVIGNESKDLATMANNNFTLLQTLAANPQFLNDPVNKELAFAYAEQIGANVGRLEIADSKRQSQQQQQQAQQGQRLPNAPRQQTEEEEQLAEVA
jgi:hypothetical protein